MEANRDEHRLTHQEKSLVTSSPLLLLLLYTSPIGFEAVFPVRGRFFMKENTLSSKFVLISVGSHLGER
jgi:hypothetical protein